MAAPIKKIIHRFVYDISEYEPGGSQANKIIPLDTQIYAYYPETYDKSKHAIGLYFVLGDGQHTYDELRRGLGIYDSAKEYGTYDPEEIAELRQLIEGRVPKNPNAVEGTGIKITTDENGLVIDLAELSQDDIPSIPLSKISDVLATAQEVNYLSGTTSNVQGQLDTLTTNLESEIATRSSDVQTLTTNLEAEVTARQQADTALENQITTLSGNAVKYDEVSGEVNKQSITLEGTGAGTKITNLAPGTVSANSKDAINGSQLQSVKDDVNTKQPKLTASNAGDGIEITGEGSNVKITNTRISAIWGNIQGNLNNQTDLKDALDSKQDNLSEGTGIDITANTVSLDATLTNLNDVTISSPTNNEFLTYNANTSKWLNILLTEIDGGDAGEAPVLPTLVTYIQGAGGYINTGYCPHLGDVYTLEVEKITNASSSAVQPVFASNLTALSELDETDNGIGYGPVHSDRQHNIKKGSGRYWNYDPDAGNWANDGFKTIRVSIGSTYSSAPTVSLNSNAITLIEEGGTTASEFSTTTPIGIFCSILANGNADCITTNVYRLKYFKVERNNEVIADFRAAISGNEVGLYDTVSQSFVAGVGNLTYEA